ncbi:unnamed protein product, partial [Prorocentrum cordatum]
VQGITKDLVAKAMEDITTMRAEHLEHLQRLARKRPRVDQPAEEQDHQPDIQAAASPPLSQQ